jgi:hypothetical protein
MIKSKHILGIISWGIVFALIYSLMYDPDFGYINLFDDMESISIKIMGFQISKPFVYRVLIPLLMYPITAAGIDPLHALAGVQLVFGLLSYWALIKFLSLWIGGDGIFLHSVLCFSFVFFMCLYNRSYYDYSTMFFFCLSCLLLYRLDLKWYFILFPIATLNRETTFLLIYIFAVYLRDDPRINRSLYWIGIAYQAGTWFFIRLMLDHAFSGNGGAYQLFVYDMLGFYLRSPFVFFIVPAFLLVMISAFYKWAYIPHLLRVVFSLFPILFLLHLILGYPFEFRVLMESLPAVYVILFTKKDHIIDPV